MREVAPYTGLASGYDVVMEHVDYEAWAEFVHGLIRRFAPGTRSVLELACGTGSFADAMQPLGDYEYLATDASEEMLGVARAKARLTGSNVAFMRTDFREFSVDRPVDVVILLYDGINYVLEPDGIARVFECVARSLRPEGLFVFDLSTPVNSENNAEWFDDEGAADAFSYRRTSSYDPLTRIHVTTLEMDVAGETFREIHRERAYTMEEIVPLVEAAGFRVEAMLDGFTSRDADSRSERIHCVVRRLADVSAKGPVATFTVNESTPPQ